MNRAFKKVFAEAAVDQHFVGAIRLGGCRRLVDRNILIAAIPVAGITSHR